MFRAQERFAALRVSVNVVDAPYYDPDHDQYPLDYLRSVSDTIHQVVRRIPGVTMLPDFPADCSLFFDTVHLNRKGGEQFPLEVSINMVTLATRSLFVAIMDGVNVSYGVHDNRPWWRRRLQAIILTVVESVLFLGAALSILLWPKVMGWLGLGVAARVTAGLPEG